MTIQCAAQLRFHLLFGKQNSPPAEQTGRFTKTQLLGTIIPMIGRRFLNSRRKGGLMVRMWSVLGGAVVALHAMSSVVLAQDPARLPGQEPGFTNYMVAVGLVVVVCVTALINPKRSHLT